MELRVSIEAYPSDTPTLQWVVDGVPIPNATGTSFLFVPEKVGQFSISVSATNPAGRSSPDPTIVDVVEDLLAAPGAPEPTGAGSATSDKEGSVPLISALAGVVLLVVVIVVILVVHQRRSARAA